MTTAAAAAVQVNFNTAHTANAIAAPPATIRVTTNAIQNLAPLGAGASSTSRV
jgi:hypothetical protein